MTSHTQSLNSAHSAITAKGTSDSLVPAAVVSAELGVVRRTLARWVDYPNLNFPKPLLIQGRWYFRRVELEAWKLNRARLSVGEHV
ncbi:hypothetical protein SAMN05444581_105117 [Methylocapsa palsarum]|uniref:Transcriptional regulator, AlpA family n=1 Tax=Methylocapsa palsarum TaxID=1612308 RepID=A0A1I3Y9Y5_9HYPH|nr:hypothetical protein SAMN05444581_105117 [Methylocapsa palsarum]